MALMKSLQEKLPEPGYIYSQIIEKSLEPALSEAAKLIEQALEDYEPLDYENEKTREKLAQALEKLAEKDWQEQEMAVPALVIEIYGTALLSALEMSRGEWEQAEKLSEKTLDLARKLVEIEEGLKAFNGLDDLLQEEDISKLPSLSAQKHWDLSALSRQSLLSLSLLASLQYFNGCLAQQQLKLKEALDYFNASIQTYEKALKLISLLSLSKLEKRDEVELETGLIHALQRVHKRLADLAAAEVLFPLADQHYLKIIELAEKTLQRTFQFEMLKERPAYFRLFDAHARREADEKSLEDYQIAQDSFSTLKWQALLSLDFPDLEEIAELFNFHYARIEAWLEETGRETIRNPKEDVTPVLTLLENLMDLESLFLDSELFDQIQQENDPEQRKEELKDLYQVQLARFQKGLRDIREGKEPPFFEYHYDFWLTPRERDLYNQYDNYFDRALEYEFSEDLYNKEDDRALKAYYTSLLYLSALINQCSNPMSQEEFEVKLYELYEQLAQYYIDHNDPKQAARFLEKAYFYEKDLCLEEFDYEPKDKAELCFSLALVMEDLEQKEKAKKYRLECITQQLSQIEVELDYMAQAATREAILKLPSVNQLQEYLDLFFGEAPLEEVDEFFEDLLAQEDHPQGRKYLIELLFFPEQFKGWDE